MAALPTFLPLPEAARKFGLEESRLHALVETGKIGAAVAMGEVVVSEEEVRSQVTKKEDLPEYRQFSYLSNVAIGMGEASRKYKVGVVTIHGWVKKGIIAIIGREGQKVLIDEADVAYCANIYHKIGGQGKRIFNSDGTPYQSKANSPKAI